MFNSLTLYKYTLWSHAKSTHVLIYYTVAKHLQVYIPTLILAQLALLLLFLLLALYICIYTFDAMVHDNYDSSSYAKLQSTATVGIYDSSNSFS